MKLVNLLYLMLNDTVVNMDLGTYICLGFIVMMLVFLLIVKISENRK